MEKFRCLPGVEGSAEILLATKDAELLQLMVSMVQDHLVTEIFLQLAKQASCEVWLLFEVREVELPLVMEKGFGGMVENLECGAILERLFGKLGSILLW